MRILQLYRKIGKHEGNTISSVLFADRNDNLFTLSYLSGNIEIMVENDSVVVDDVLEAYNEYKELENES